MKDGKAPSKKTKGWCVDPEIKATRRRPKDVDMDVGVC